MKFYEKFLRLCNERNVAPSKAGTDIGVSRSAVSRWVSGQTVPTSATIHKIAAYFDVPASYFDEDGVKVPEFNLQLFAAAQERVLLDAFRQLDEVNKTKALVYISELAQS